MIPYKDDNPVHHLPVVTYAIIVLNSLTWILLQEIGQEPGLSQSVCRYGVIPAALPGIASGHIVSEGYCPVTDPSWSVLITSMFMHGSWLHLIGNMWFLWIFADNIEDVLRPPRFILFYLLGGIVAVGAQVLVDGESLIPMVGASGAISGVMGAYAWLFPRVRVRMAIILGFFIFRQTIPAWVMLGIWLLLQAASGYVSLQSSTQGGVAFWAHVGGFLAGFIFIRFFYSAPPRMAWK